MSHQTALPVGFVQLVGTDSQQEGLAELPGVEELLVELLLGHFQDALEEHVKHVQVIFVVDVVLDEDGGEQEGAVDLFVLVGVDGAVVEEDAVVEQGGEGCHLGVGAGKVFHFQEMQQVDDLEFVDHQTLHQVFQHHFQGEHLVHFLV